MSVPGTTSDLLSRWMRIAESAQQEADWLRADIAANRERIAALEKLLREARCALGGEDSADYAWSGAQGADFDSLRSDIAAALGEEASDGE